MKSIIYVTSRRLLPLNSGDKVLTFNILKRLSKIYDIHLYNLNEGSAYTKDEILKIKKISKSFKTVQFDNSHSLFKILKSLFLNKMYLKVKTYNKQIEKDLTDFLNLDLNAEYIVWDHLRSSLFFSSNKFKNILIEHNNEADIFFERAEKERIPLVKYLIKKQARFLKAYVEDIHTKMDRIIYLNKNDFLNFVEKKPKKYILMDKLLIDFEHNSYEIKQNTDEKINLLFVGSLDWYPNIDALEWFLEEVFPYLKNKNNYHLDIVGRDPSKAFIKKINKYSNVDLHRNVPSVEEYYLRADIVLMPIRRGSGINIKVLEALSYGIPIVMTSFAKRGYDGLDFIPGADKAESFAANIDQLADIMNRKELSVKELMYYDDYQKNTDLVIRNLFDTF
ncbi:glycosyltransferase [Sulfurovum sp. XTW-4]|uniref:Glycosyltransferase n=1 Tax=Sulfurovum xiamenensis TaxID=3019066 RepID=A0ABT7QTP2_9BACT|nr:glycosyltransferase [Sulfurovum xiamenensis]MDM5264386.1 glycosyltransferase [Sulfurovum xiamenensis]